MFASLAKGIDADSFIKESILPKDFPKVSQTPWLYGYDPKLKVCLLASAWGPALIGGLYSLLSLRPCIV